MYHSDLEIMHMAGARAESLSEFRKSCGSRNDHNMIRKIGSGLKYGIGFLVSIPGKRRSSGSGRLMYQ